MRVIKFLSLSFLVSLSSTECIAQDYKDLEPPEGKSLLYIYRPSVAGTVIPMPIVCDDRMIGSTRGRTFVFAYIDPGKHTLTAEAERPVSIEIETEAGKTYYVRQKVKMGMAVARTDLVLVEESEGRAKLKKCCKTPKNWTPKD